MSISSQAVDTANSQPLEEAKTKQQQHPGMPCPSFSNTKAFSISFFLSFSPSGPFSGQEPSGQSPRAAAPTPTPPSERPQPITARRPLPAAQRGFELKAADRRGTAPSERAGISYSRRAPLGSSPPHSPAGEEMQQRVLLRAARHTAAASAPGCPAGRCQQSRVAARARDAGGRRSTRHTRARDAQGGKRLLPAAARRFLTAPPRRSLRAQVWRRRPTVVYAKGSSGFTVSENIGNTSAVSLIQAKKITATSTYVFKTCSFPQPLAHLDPIQGYL